MVRSSKNPQKLHKSCLCTGSGQEGEGESVVSLRGACLGGRGKDRSWQATTKVPGRGGKGVTRLSRAQNKQPEGLPRGSPREAVNVVESQTSWEYSYAGQEEVGGSSLNEMLRYLIMAVRSKAKVNRKVWCQQLGLL